MASMWRYSVVLIGTNSLKTSLNFLIPADGIDIDAEFTEAHAAMVNLALTLAAVTDANFYAETLALQVSGSPSLPADADITDEAAVITYLTGTGVAPKYHVVRVPAPIAGMFNADLVTVDITNQPLQDFIADLSAYVEVSDGESINLDVDEGIASGFWRSVKKTSR